MMTTNTSHCTAPQIRRRREVCQQTGLGRTTLYEEVKAGRFPRPIKIGPRAVGWLAHEVDKWIEDRAVERDGNAKARL